MGSPARAGWHRIPALALATGLCLASAACDARSDRAAKSVEAKPAQVPPRFDYAMGLGEDAARNAALEGVFADWISADLRGLNEMLAGWRRDDGRWARALPALTRVLPALSDRIGKEPALVHLLHLTSAAYARLSPGEAVNWARASFGRAAEDVALSVMVEEVATVSPEKATRLTGEIGDPVIRLDALCGIARTLAAKNGKGAFTWVGTLPEENRADVAKAALDAWAHASPGMAMAYAVHEKIPGGLQVVFARWAADAPEKAAIAARTLSDPKARATAASVVADTLEAAVPIDGKVEAWARTLPKGAGRDAVNALLAGSQASSDPATAWLIAAAIDEEKARGEARREVIATVASDDPEIAVKLIESDGELPPAEAAALRGLIAGAAGGDLR